MSQAQSATQSFSAGHMLRRFTFTMRPAEDGLEAPQRCREAPRHGVPQGVCLHGPLCHHTDLLHEAEFVTDAQNPLLAFRTACERVLQQDRHIEEGEWLTLRCEYQDFGRRVE